MRSLQLSPVSFLFCQPWYCRQLQGKAINFLLLFPSKGSLRGYLRPSIFVLPWVRANIAKLSLSVLNQFIVAPKLKILALPPTL